VVPWSVQADFAGWRADAPSWQPPAELRHLHVPVLVASLWRRLIDAVRDPAIRLDDGGVVVLGIAIFERDPAGALHARLWREKEGCLQWDPCPDDEIVLQALPAGWIWLDLIRRAAVVELAHHLKASAVAPMEGDLERYGRALFEHFRRRLARHADLRVIRQRVARALDLDPAVLRIARRLMNLLPDRGLPRLSYYNTVVRHREAFLSLERELPQAIPLYGALVDRGDFPRRGWPAQALHRYLVEHDLSPAIWRLIVAAGPRLFLPVRHFYRGDAGTAMLDYLRILSDLRLQVEPHPHLIWCLLSRVANPGFRFERHRENLVRHRHRFGHAARHFMRDPEVARADLPDVLEWLAAECPQLDKLQRRAGWPWLVRQTRQWLELRQREIDAEAVAWDVPFDELIVEDFVFRSLKSVRDLWDEARAMHHCADDYASRCAGGEVLIVSIRHRDAPQRRRATAMLERVGGAWRVAQVRARANRNPPARVAEAAARLVAQLNVRSPAGTPAADIAVTIGSPAAGVAPRRMPPNARFIGEVSWSWSPMHCRREQYFVCGNRARTLWLLWVRWFDDNYSVWRTPEVVAYCERGRLTDRVAARGLIRQYWAHDAQHGNLDRFHELECSGLLEPVELEEMADSVWPE
jgi:hypothetical protein